MGLKDYLKKKKEEELTYCHYFLVTFRGPLGFFNWVRKINSRSGISGQPGVITEKSKAGFFEPPAWNHPNLILNLSLLLVWAPPRQRMTLRNGVNSADMERILS